MFVHSFHLDQTSTVDTGFFLLLGGPRSNRNLTAADVVLVVGAFAARR